MPMLMPNVQVHVDVNVKANVDVEDIIAPNERFVEVEHALVRRHIPGYPRQALG